MQHDDTDNKRPIKFDSNPLIGLLEHPKRSSCNPFQSFQNPSTKEYTSNHGGVIRGGRWSRKLWARQRKPQEFSIMDVFERSKRFAKRLTGSCCKGLKKHQYYGSMFPIRIFWYHTSNMPQHDFWYLLRLMYYERVPVCIPLALRSFPGVS